MANAFDRYPDRSAASLPGRTVEDAFRAKKTAAETAVGFRF